ncbi:MAG: hypothetical protein ACE5J2_04645 [Nitrososphaerales archaeon]
MRKSALVLISGGIILASGFAALGIMAQSALSEMTEYNIGPHEVIEVRERIETSEFFNGVYVVEFLEYQEGDTLNVEIKDPEGMRIVSRELSSSFTIENFDFEKSGEYTMTLENTSFRSIIKVAAALGGQVYSGTDPLITVAMPSYVVITGIIILMAGGVMYYKERSGGKYP